jgi:hypothetical protein
MNAAMKKGRVTILATVALGAVILLNTGSSALAQTGVGVSVSIHQPGIYGRVDIGHYPYAQLVVQQPVVVAPTPIAIHRQPIYLYVPSSHRRSWDRYCGDYHACAQPVYFVREGWGQQPYAMSHDHGARDDRGRGHRRGGKHATRRDD